MTGTLRILRSELMRIVYSRSPWVIGIAIGLLAALRSFASTTAIVGRGVVESGGAYGPLVDGITTGLTLTAFALLVMSARSIAGDHESGQLRMAVTRSVARPALVMGRLLLGPLPILGGLLLSFCGAWWFASNQLDFGPLMEDGYELLSPGEMRTEIQLALQTALPALFALWAFGLLVSSVARTAVGAVATALVLFVAFDLVKDSLGPDLKYLCFASFAPSLADSSAMGETAGFVRGFSDKGMRPHQIALGQWLSWVQSVLLGLASVWVLRRRAL